MFCKSLFNKRKLIHLYRLITKYPFIQRTYFHHLLQNKNKSLFNHTKKISNIQFDNKCYTASNTYSSDSDSESEKDLIELEENDTKLNNNKIRNILKFNRIDPIINELNRNASVQDVFQTITKNESTLNKTHVIQAILVLWDLQKCFYTHNSNYQNEANIKKLLSSNTILKHYIEQVKQHDDFKKLIKLVENKYKNFSFDELTCSLLYLTRIGVSLDEGVMQKLIYRCEKEIENSELEDISLTALSRFTVAVFHEDHYLWSILVTKNVIPIIISLLQKCDSVDDFKKLTICFNKMRRIITNDTLNLYKEVALKMLSEGKITSANHRTVLKVILFLNQPHWNDQNTPIIRKYFYILTNHINQLTNAELIQLFKVFQIVKEPADMLEEIQQCALNRLSEIEESEYNLELSLDLLSSVVSFSSPLQRPKYEKLAESYFKNSLTQPSLSAMFKILYHIKSENKKLCNKFWNKTLEQIENENPHSKLNKLLNLCHKYMHFYTDISNKHRYYRFEKKVIQLLLQELDYGFDSLITYKFSRIAGFIVAFNYNVEVLHMITNKILKIRRFSSIDCLNLSKALQIAYGNTKNLHTVQKYFNQIKEVLDDCIRNELIVKKNLDIQNINVLARGYTFRKGDTDSDVFKLILDNFISTENQFSSHIIRDLSFFLQINNCLVPSLMDKMINYIVENEKSIFGNTVDKLLYLNYYLGFCTETEEFFKSASSLLIRDKDRFSGLTFIQSALALCFYHKLPETLVKHIFSVEFLEKLDEEISNCYSKTTYPIRVRSQMMQLNRAVCLDYPESNVPWFHQKFVETNKLEIKMNYFRKKVFTSLQSAIQDKRCLSQDILTPYGYQLDFEVNLEKEMARKIAFVLINQNAYTKINKNLKGFYQLKKRHLEILGYDVFFENQNDWQDLDMHSQCIDYLKEKIWPKQKCKNMPVVV